MSDIDPDRPNIRLGRNGVDQPHLLPSLHELPGLYSGRIPLLGFHQAVAFQFSSCRDCPPISCVFQEEKQSNLMTDQREGTDLECSV